MDAPVEFGEGAVAASEEFESEPEGDWEVGALAGALGVDAEVEEVDCGEDFVLLCFSVETCAVLFSGLSAEVWLLSA